VYVKKLLRYTVIMDTNVPADADYENISPEEAKTARVELPVDTDEKKAIIEAWFLRSGDISVGEIAEIAGKFDFTITVVDDPTDPRYLGAQAP
jgi:hypothetical protein